MLFVRFIARLWSFVSALPFWLAFPLAVALCPLWLARLVVRSVLFVRFPRPPHCPAGCGSIWRYCRALGLPCGWRCVSAGSLAGVRCSCFVWSVRPAVVRRHSGVVLFFWVWVSPTPF